jgi:hypothetical protein
MANVFSSVGRPCFAVSKEPLYASEYLVNKKSAQVCSKKRICCPYNQVPVGGWGAQGDYLARVVRDKYSFDTTQLYAGLSLKERLGGVEVLSSPVLSLPYSIDPLGELFGNRPCETNRYVRYLR